MKTFDRVQVKNLMMNVVGTIGAGAITVEEFADGTCEVVSEDQYGMLYVLRCRKTDTGSWEIFEEEEGKEEGFEWV